MKNVARKTAVLFWVFFCCFTPNASSSPIFNPPQNAIGFSYKIEKNGEDKKYTRESMIFTYQEWKKIKEIPNPPRNDEEIKSKLIAQIKIIPKIILITDHPDKAYGLLTEEEKKYYELEMHMFDVEDAPIYRVQIMQRYNLNFSPEEFKKNIGVKILWFLDRHYGYKYSQEQAEKDKKHTR